MKKALLILISLIAVITAKAQDSEMLSFPYTWGADSWQSEWAATGTWASGDDQLYISGRKSNWRGAIHTTSFIDFPANETVEISFLYKSDAGIDFSLFINREAGSTADRLYENTTLKLDKSASDFTRASFTFAVEQAGEIEIQVSPQVARTASASFYIKDICVNYPMPDVAVKEIISPYPNKVATGNMPLTVNFTNAASTRADGVKFSYSVDGGTPVSETYSSGLEANESVNYTFTNPVIVSSGDHVIRITASCNNDGRTDNNEITTVITGVNPATFPFTDRFSDGLANWTVVNPTMDDLSWNAGTVNTDDGVAMIPNGYSDLGDSMWTIPVNMPAGLARVSFYYATMTGAGRVSLRLLGGRVPNPDEMQELLVLPSLSNTGWLNAYAPVDVKEAGVWYFAIVADGAFDGIFVDNFFVDNGEDLSAESVSFDTTSGFNKSTSKVSFTFANHGVSTQSGIEVAYSINSSGEVKETIGGSVAPGESYTHIFATPADISTQGETYYVTGRIVTPVGSDIQNDTMTGEPVTHWASLEVPYSQDFETAAETTRWKLYAGSESNSKWIFQDWYYNGYSGDRVLNHNAAKGNVDDWAISECIAIPAGDYDISFFYRTNLNESATQTLSLMMGDGDTPADMTREITSIEDFCVSGAPYRKSIARVSIDKAGNYYFGFHNTSEANGGSTVIDLFEITPVIEGMELPYESDFNNNSADWTIYNDTNKFTRWELVDEDGDSVFTVNHDEDASDYKVPEGMLVSPKLTVKGGYQINIGLEYACTTDFDGNYMVLYGSPVNDPDSFTMLEELPVTTGIVKHETTIPAFENDGEYFVGIRSNRPLELNSTTVKNPEDIYTLKLKSLKMSYGERTGIAETGAANGISISRVDNSVIVTVPDTAASIDIYDVNGRCLRSISGTASRFTIPFDGYKGMIIVKVSTTEGTATAKVIL